MKITKTFTRQCDFFFDDLCRLGICVPFIINLLPDISSNHINVLLSTKNPKKKGYHKVTRIDEYYVELNEKEFSVCFTERKALDACGVKVGDSFWMKVEEL